MDYSKVKVAYPKLTLYAFHLRHNLAQGDKEPVKNANHLWQKCQKIGQKLGIAELENLSIPKEPQILDEGIIEFTPTKQQNNLDLTGEVNPLQIHDTYALDLTFRYKHPELELANLNGLNQDDCLLPNNIKASFGQTLVFFAQPVGRVDDEKAFADACVKALISEDTFKQLELSYQGQGKLLNSPIFEYNNNADSAAEQCHILIWLNTNQQTTDLEEAGEYYYPLIDLLNYRSKIIYARSEASWCYQEARKYYSNLEDKVNQFERVKNQPVADQLKDFNQWLNEIPEISFGYARYLRDLELHKTTIKTNIKNYKLYLDTIKQLCKEDDLEFLSSFLELAEDTFVEQINTDLAYLTPGQSLFEQLIESIRGIVEIEQAKIDRETQNLLRKKEQTDKTRNENLQIAIAVLGFGLSAAQIGAGTASYIIPQQQSPKQIEPPFTTPQPHPFALSVGLSLIFGLVGAFVGWGFSSLSVGGRFSNLFEAIARLRIQDNSSHSPALTEPKEANNENDR